MKKVMLLGDSIRMSYQEEVQRCLGEDYNVWGFEKNGRYAKYTLNELREYVKVFGTPDIIHWNNGLWDTQIEYVEDGAFTPIDEYMSYIRRILRELRKLTPYVIFATTTPVRPQIATQKNEIIDAYNACVVDFMKANGVMVNDLNVLVASDRDRYLCEDNMHLSNDGVAVCGRAVADCIRAIDM